MALVNSDIIRFTVNQTIGATVVRNVDYRRYDDTGMGGNTYAEIALAYANAWTANVLQLSQAIPVVFVELVLDNVTNGLDFFTLPVVSSGVEIGELLPNFVAIPIKQNRETKLTRNGSKRIAGLVESRVNGNILALTGAQILGLEDMFGTPVLVLAPPAVNAAELAPVIVGRTLNPVTGQYELDLGRISNVTSALVGGFVTSQVSRKRGVGE